MQLANPDAAHEALPVEDEDEEEEVDEEAAQAQMIA